MHAVLTFALAGLVTYLLRAMVLIGGRLNDRRALGSVVPSGAGDDRDPSGGLRRRLSPLAGGVGLISPAVLGAVVAAGVFVTSSRAAAESGPGIPASADVVAVVAALVAVRRTGSLASALAVGFPVFWILTLAGLG